MCAEPHCYEVERNESKEEEWDHIADPLPWKLKLLLEDPKHKEGQSSVGDNPPQTLPKSPNVTRVNSIRRFIAM